MIPVSPGLVSFHLDAASTTLNELREKYRALKMQQERLILSACPYEDIASKVVRSSNSFLKEILRPLLLMIWKDLGIPLDSDAVLFFRNMKTFSSDVDLFYWGPRIQEVNMRLSQLLFMMGLKNDLHTMHLMTDEVILRRIDFDVYLYFFGGEAIVINQGSFHKFYQDHVRACANPAAMWNHVYPYLCRQLSAWNGKPTDLSLTENDYKKLHHRAITNLLFGLSVKFNIPFGPDEGAFFIALGQHLKPEEIRALEEALALVNQARNLYQIISRRRWEKVDPRIASEIERILDLQGQSRYHSHLQALGQDLENMREKYFGLPDFRTTPFLPLLTDDRASRAWCKVARDYSFIASSTFSRSLERQNSELDMAAVKAANVFHEIVFKIQDFRARLPRNQHRPIIVTIDGISGSGKTTIIATALKDHLLREGFHVAVDQSGELPGLDMFIRELTRAQREIHVAEAIQERKEDDEVDLRLFDWEAARKFSAQIEAFRDADTREEYLIVPNAYHRLSKTHGPRQFLLTRDSIVIVEGTYMNRIIAADIKFRVLNPRAKQQYWERVRRLAPEVVTDIEAYYDLAIEPGFNKYAQEHGVDYFIDMTRPYPRQWVLKDIKHETLSTNPDDTISSADSIAISL